MPALPEILICIAVAAIFWTLLGFGLARFFISEPALNWAAAPALGWAVFNASALPLTFLTSFTRSSVAMIAVLVSATALLLGRQAVGRARISISEPPGIPGWGFGLAMLLAIVPAMAILPKYADGVVLLTAKMYDHSKIAIVDDIVRLGTPPGDPFFGAAGAHLAYYYLWHFSAAFLAKLLGTGGWTGDIALTWFTAFAALMLMMGLAVHFSGRQIAALWVALLSLSLSLRPILAILLGPAAFDRLLPDNGLQGWILQASWSPQHLAGATCLVLAVFLLCRLSDPRRKLLWPILALVIAAGFESSTWIGGIAFAAAALPISVIVLFRTSAEDRRRFIIRAGLTAGSVLLISYPFLRDEYIATLGRHAGTPLAFHPYEVLGEGVARHLRRIVDVPAYWLFLLPIEFPAAYLLGSFALGRLITSRSPFADKTLVAVLGVTALACFGITWLVISTIMNNDLGWRAILPGLLILTVFAAAGITRWTAGRASAAGAAAMVLLLLGLPDGWITVSENASGMRTTDDRAFAPSAELWAAVRQHSAPDERVLNNPQFLGAMAGSPINISWALLADRRSCFAGANFAMAFVPLPAGQIADLDALVQRVFNGTASPEEVRGLATDYDCRLIVITPDDGAWSHDEFADNPSYRLVDEKPGRWRLYRSTSTSENPS